MSLESLLTYREPLGPIDQSHIHADQDVDALLNDKVTPFSEAISKAPILLLGRKGSGKSAILAELRLRANDSAQSAHVSEAPPAKGQPIVLSVHSWDRFFNITRHVAAQYREANPEFDAELVPMEYLSTLWQQAIWDEIIKHFYNFCHHKDCRHILGPVEKFILADGRYSGPSKGAALELFNAAKACILKFAAERQSHIIFLFDSMERYPVRNVVFSEVLGGLLMAINAVHYESEFISVTFCLPEEIESHLMGASANILKDYSVAYRIKWKPIDLLKVIAHRFLLFAKYRDPELYNKIRNFDPNSRDGIHGIFISIFPKTIKNSMGTPEDPLAYIIRHTQLLPRHAIAIFNGIISRAYQEDAGKPVFDQSAIVDGVLSAEKLIAQQIIQPYVKIYPDLLSACDDLLCSLPPICSYGELRKLESRFKGRREDDVLSVWKTLFSMGIIGKVSAEDGVLIGSTRYCEALFHYNIDGAFGFSEHAKYCFHPIFSRYYGISRDISGERRAIYPANVEIFTI